MSARFVAATDETFDEEGYLAANPDVEQAVRSGFFPSGRRHFELHGRAESRMILRAEPATRVRRWRDRVRKSDALDPAIALRLEGLQARTYDLEVALMQLGDMLSYGQGFVPPPPKHLQQRVVGSYTGSFIRSGFVSVYPQLQRALATVGHQLEDFARILDFGCGCGRATYALRRLLPEAELCGTDIDDEAIGWLQENWSHVADFVTCPMAPPMTYDAGTFDFIFGISVMTHLPEDLQLSWLEELERVTAPDGYVLLTTHGSHVWEGQLDDAQRTTIEQSGFLYTRSGYGASIGLPDFYETAFHAHEYIRRVWSRHFDVVGIWEPEVGEHQDTVLLRRHDR